MAATVWRCTSAACLAGPVSCGAGRGAALRCCLNLVQVLLFGTDHAARIRPAPLGCARPGRGWQNAEMSSPPQPALALVATSARSLVECAVGSGYAAFALDVFADRDTCRLARACVAVGRGGATLDESELLAALAALRARGDVAGWVAGSGLEAQPALLAAAARVLPLIGNAPEVVRRVRTPVHFHQALERLGIAHPAFSAAPPVDPSGWLRKDAHACGGWHVRHAGAAAVHGVLGALGAGGGDGIHFQRYVAGEPMSCLFLAAGEGAAVLGHSRQIVRPLGRRPFVFRGGVGPVPLEARGQASLAGAATALTRAFGLRGLNGIDYVLDAAGTPWVLELNPRPTAAIQLFGAAFEGGLMRAHVEACAGRLRPPVPSGVGGVRGYETVFARRAGRLDEAAVHWLERQGWCKDIPQPGTQHAWGDPLCTVVAEASSADAVMRQLDARRRALRAQLQS